MFTLLPGTPGHALIAILHPVIEVVIANRAERRVVKAHQSESFMEVFAEFVKRLEMLGKGWHFVAIRRCEKLLITAINQLGNVSMNQ